MQVNATKMNNIIFVFKKNSDKVVTLHGFKTEKGTELTLIDDDKKDLSFHQILLEIEQLNEAVNSHTWLVQKSIQVQLQPEVYKRYIESEFSKNNFKENPGSFTPVSASAPPADLATVFSQLMLQQQQSNAMMLEKFMASMSLLIEKKESKMNITHFDGQSEDATT